MHAQRMSGKAITLAVTTLLLGVQSLTIPQAAHADPTANVFLRNMSCWKKTESGHDEIYAIVSVVLPNGETRSAVVPSNNKDGDADGGLRWDMSTSGSKHDRFLRYPLATVPLNPGETALVRLTLMESDGTSYKSILNAASNLTAALASGNPYVVIGSAIANLLGDLIPDNEDDFLGSALLVFTNDGGTLSREVMTDNEYTSVFEEWDDSDRGGFGPGVTIQFNGSGALYHLALNTYLG